jgi:predicted lipoprotein with Yx(FWY)xxD motif
MRKVVPALFVCLLTVACGGKSDVPGIVIADGDDDAQGDGDGAGPLPGDGDGDEPTSGEDGGVQEQPEEDAGKPAGEVPGANLRFAESEQLGKYLVDAEGHALYIHVNDAAGKEKTTCLGECATAWPPFDLEAAKPGNGIAAEDVDRIHRDDGAWQVTYKGFPLYYHDKDKNSTDITGDAIDENGAQAYDGQARWYVARKYDTFFYVSTLVRPEGQALFNKPFLTDGAGRAVYVYLSDTPGKNGSKPVSTCTTAECQTKWPVWSDATKDLVLPSNLDASDFGSFEREDGTSQMTYRGYPLYYFADDDLPGEVAGHNVGDWRVIEPMTFAIGTP